MQYIHGISQAENENKFVKEIICWILFSRILILAKETRHKMQKKKKSLVQVLTPMFIYRGDTLQFSHFSGCGEIPFQDRCGIFLTSIRWR